ncbi:MAG: hypothetical protein MRY64_02535 [Hyphomonadaceae bacterium]|nr:hypothetical protein [Hyphomonadaceae bacterium]
MTQGNFTRANKRYRRIFWPLMAVYVALCFGGTYVINQGWISGTVATAAIAVAISAPIVGVFLLMLRLVEETDEYTRLRQLKSMVQGALFTISVAVVIGFLQLFDLVGQFWTFWFGPLFFLAWGLAYCRDYFSGKAA